MAWFDYLMATLTQGMVGVTVAGLTLVLMVIALVRSEPILMVLAAIFTMPFTHTWGAWSGILIAVRLLPLLQFGSAFAISKHETLIAWVLPIIPFILVLSYLVRIVLAQFPGF